MTAMIYTICGALLLSGCSADFEAPSCSDYTVKTGAANQLSEWLNRKVGKGNAYHVHGTFVAEISASVAMGALQGTQQCHAIASVGIRRHDGTLLIAQETISLGFLLAGEQITFDEGELLSKAADTADSLLVKEAMRERSSVASTDPQ